MYAIRSYYDRFGEGGLHDAERLRRNADTPGVEHAHRDLEAQLKEGTQIFSVKKNGEFNDFIFGVVIV